MILRNLFELLSNQRIIFDLEYQISVIEVQFVFYIRSKKCCDRSLLNEIKFVDDLKWKYDRTKKVQMLTMNSIEKY